MISNRYAWRTGRVALLLFFVVVLSVPAPAKDLAAPAGQAKYVFLFIGDGLAQAQRAAAEYYLAAMRGHDRPGMVRLAMNGLPVHGATTTYSLNSIITDSGAAGTALACGVKSYNGAIAVDGAKNPVKTVAEMARDRGMKVGIVSTVSLDHATPASFYAHQASRNNYYEISLEAPASRFNYFAGGGFKDPEGKKSKKDGPKTPLMEAFKAAGYAVAADKASIEGLRAGQDKVLAVNPVLDHDKAMPYALDADPAREVSLAAFTAKGIELLDNPAGFFMMVEGGKVDWACHANDAVSSIQDVLALDEAVSVALAFAAQHPDETLIVVTGDHECGGLALGFAGTKYGNYYEYLKNQKLSFLAFSDKLAAFKKDRPAGQAKLEDLAPLIQEGFGLILPTEAELEAMKNGPKPDENTTSPADPHGLHLRAHELAMIREAFDRSMAGEKEKPADPAQYLHYGDYEPLTVTLTRVLDAKAGLGWTTFSHTGMPVPTTASGPGAQAFTGYYDNTDLAKRLMAALGVAVVAEK